MIVGFDTETTGLDAETEEIVTAAIVKLRDNGEFDIKNWLLKTNKESSEEAFSKHRVSHEESQTNGQDYAEAILEIANVLLEASFVITANGAFDMTMLQSSLDRYIEDDDVPDISQVKMIDVMVIDKYVDKYRKGPRKLENLAKHYGVNTEGLFHDASFDAITAYAIYTQQIPLLEDAGVNLDDIHSFCEREYMSQKQNLADYFKRIDKKASIGTGYPVNTGVIEIG